MKTVVHARAYGRFIEIQNVRRKKVHRTSQDSNFLGDSFSNRDNRRSPKPILKRKTTPASYKIIFLSRTDPSIFTSNKKS